MKKTIQVSRVKCLANHFNEVSTGKRCQGIREGQNVLLETILHETGNYQGFNYLRQSEVPKGELPGVIMSSTPKLTDNIFPDDSRRIYY